MHKELIKVGIIGGAGYTGGELIRLLLNHPAAKIVFIQSKSNAGNSVCKVHGDMLGDNLPPFSENYHFDIDVLFFCAGHGETLKFVSQNTIPDSVKLIDIGNDFRLKADAKTGNRNFIYGLPELNREAIKNANSIANPGCFATAIQLALLPLAAAGKLTDTYTTGITGATGGGQAFSETAHFSWRVNNIQAYKTLSHQHLGEINESLTQLQPAKVAVNFIPWRGDFARGIFTSSQMSCEISLTELYERYDSYYNDHPFVFTSREPIHMKQVVNTNKCIIQLEKVDDRLVIHSVIDNLVKGASGQAVQNMNLLFGLDETTGLQLKANYF